MAKLRISEASEKALQERLASPEGKEALMKLARLIADAAIKAMAPELLASLDTREGKKAFRAAWPDMVSAFLFRGAERKPRKTRGKRRGTAKS